MEVTPNYWPVTSAKAPATSTLDLSTAADRAKIFTVLDRAITNVETTLGIQLSATNTN